MSRSPMKKQIILNPPAKPTLTIQELKKHMFNLANNRNGPFIAYRSPQGQKNVCILIYTGNLYGFRCVVDVISANQYTLGENTHLAYSAKNDVEAIKNAIEGKRDVYFLETPKDFYAFLGEAAYPEGYITVNRKIEEERPPIDSEDCC